MVIQCLKEKDDVGTRKSCPPLLAVVSFVLVFLCFTKLGNMKTFLLTLSGIALMAAIAYIFQTALAINIIAPFGVAIWFIVSLVSFAQAMMLKTK